MRLFHETTSPDPVALFPIGDISYMRYNVTFCHLLPEKELIMNEKNKKKLEERWQKKGLKSQSCLKEERDRAKAKVQEKGRSTLSKAQHVRSEGEELIVGNRAETWWGT